MRGRVGERGGMIKGGPKELKTLKFQMPSQDLDMYK